MTNTANISNKLEWYNRLNDHPLYDLNLSHSEWEVEVTKDVQFNWLLDNVQTPFGVVFCDYYYIICLTSEDDAAFFKLVWD